MSCDQDEEKFGKGVFVDFVILSYGNTIHDVYFKESSGGINLIYNEKTEQTFLNITKDNLKFVIDHKEVNSTVVK